jgi:hypothetical protein
MSNRMNWLHPLAYERIGKAFVEVHRKSPTSAMSRSEKWGYIIDESAVSLKSVREKVRF